MDPSRVVIVGGGFGGINCAKSLAGNPRVALTVLDRKNHHLFQPLLYQVATAGLSPAEIAMPIRAILSAHANTEVLMTNVERVELSTKTVYTTFGPVPYDYLVLACGSEQSYFGHDEWAAAAPGLKTLENATEIRRRVLSAFELAEGEKDPERLKSLLTFVIVGGGPTGVELAGAIAELIQYTLTRDFQRIRLAEARVILIEAGPKILPSFTDDLAKSASDSLAAIGVKIRVNTRVKQVTDRGVLLEDELLNSATVIWAAGVKASALNAKLDSPMDPQGRLIVTADCSLPEHPEVFAIGDQAHFEGKDKKPLPGLAPVALQQGRFVARLIDRELSSKPRGQFEYLDKGQMATIGRKRAVLQFGKFHLAGFLAWLAWLLVHVYYLIGFKNRVFVVWQWTYAYLTYKRGARLITHNQE